MKYGYEQATSSRYQTFALVFWACWAILGATYLGQVRLNWRRIAAAQIVVLALLLAMPSRYGDIEQVFVARQAGLIQGFDALASGDLKNPALRNLFPFPKRLPGYLAILREHGAGPASTLAGISGPHMGAYRLTPASDCVGHIDRAAFGGPTGYAVAGGWAWDAKDKKRLERIIVASSKGTIINWTRTDLRRPDVPENMPQVTSDTTGWNISFPASGPGPYSIFGLLGHDRLACQVGKPFTLTNDH